MSSYKFNLKTGQHEQIYTHYISTYKFHDDVPSRIRGSKKDNLDNARDAFIVRDSTKVHPNNPI